MVALCAWVYGRGAVHPDPSVRRFRGAQVMTDTIDVAALVERLTAGKAETTGHEVVWVQNMRAFIDSDMFRTFPEWRKIFREEFDNLLAASAEAATALQSQADALAEARRLHDADVDRLTKMIEHLRTSRDHLHVECSGHIASLATMREALEWYEVQVRNCRKLGNDGHAARAALDRDGGDFARRALGGSNAE